MLNKMRNPFTVFLGGLLGGVCLSLMIGSGLFYSYTMQRPSATAIYITQEKTVFQVSTRTLTPSQTNLLDEAELALNSGRPEEVRSLLDPIIENWTSNDDRIRGYNLLAEAELVQGHAQLAVPYLEKLYFYQPTAENLYFLANVYDSGGDIKNALVRYQELANWENLPPEIDREFIDMRIYHLSRSLGTPLPTYTPEQ